MKKIVKLGTKLRERCKNEGMNDNEIDGMLLELLHGVLSSVHSDKIIELGIRPESYDIFINAPDSKVEEKKEDIVLGEKTEEQKELKRKKQLLACRKQDIKYGVFKNGYDDFRKILDAFSEGLLIYEIDFAYGSNEEMVTESLNNTILKGMFEVHRKGSRDKNESQFYIQFVNKDQTELILNTL